MTPRTNEEPTPPPRHPEERSDVGIYLCDETKEQTKRHPEERSDVGIYLCGEAKEQRKIATALKSLAMTK